MTYFIRRTHVFTFHYQNCFILKRPSIKILILLAHYCVTSGYHGKVPVIFTSALTYTEYLTLESAIYILIKEVIWGI